MITGTHIESFPTGHHYVTWTEAGQRVTEEIFTGREFVEITEALEHAREVRAERLAAEADEMAEAA